MKLKKIFALALAVCMMVSAMPTTLAADGVLTSGGTSGSGDGVLTSGGGSSSLTLTSGGSSAPRITSGSVQPRQDGVLYSTGSGSEGGQSDYDFGTATDNSQTSMTINTGNTSTAQNDSTGNSVTRAETASDRLSAVEPVEPDKNQLTVSKTISETLQDSNNNPYYKIDLAAEAISNIVVQTKASAIDVILILDRSSNMTADRMSGLISAINGTDGFLETVKGKAADSRVAIVSYANAGSSTIDSAGGTIADAFVTLSDTADYNALRSAVSGLSSRVGGDAYSDEAFEKAAKIFQAVPTSDENYKNPRIVIFFTAGIPGEYGERDGWLHKVNNNYPAYLVAQESIHWSVILKAEKGDPLSVGNGSSYDINTNQEFWTWDSWLGGRHGDSRTPAATFNGATTGCGATVYCVGLELDGCTHSSKHSGDAEDCPGTKTNEYLYRISSHRPDGSHVGNSNSTKYNPWEKEATYDWGSTYRDYYTRNISTTFGTKYPEEAAISYYQVGEINDIGKMFEEINVNVEQNKPIAGVVMRDYLAPGFVPCDRNGNALSVGQTITNNGYVGTVKQDGDVYYIEWAATTMDPGEEIKASIYVKPVDNLGGRDTRTNIYGPSGLYSHDTLFASFPAPDVDIPVEQIIPDAQSFTIYLSNKADLAGLIKLDDRLDGKKNAGVTVTYTIMDGTTTVRSYTVGKGVAATSFPSEIIEDLQICKTYTVVCTVDGDAASDSDSNYRKTGESTGTVHVVKPQLTFDDVNVYLGKTPVFDDEPVLTWVSTSNHVCGTPSGKVPDIKCTFVNSKTHYLADTTVTPTATLTSTGTARSVVQEAFDVFVYAPVVTYQDTTIYLGENANFEKTSGETATANLVSTAWEHDGAAADTSKMGAAPELAFNYSEKESGMTDCQSVAVEEVGIDRAASMTVGDATYDYVDFVTFKNAGEETSNTQFTVHVLTPTVTIGEQVIYLSQSVTNVEANSGIQTGWETECEDHGKTKTGDAPALDAVFQLKGETSDTYYESVSPVECKDYTAYVTIDGMVYRDIYCDFKVHVLVPTVSAVNFAMYLGTSVNPDNEDRIGETWACEEEGEDNRITATGGRGVPATYRYNFYDGAVKLNNAYAPTTDKTITVVPTIGDTEYTDYQKTFEIDVMMPIIAVPQTRVWADYNKPVVMDTWYGIADSENTTWDENEYDIAAESEEPEITCAYEFSVISGNGKWSDSKEHEEYVQGSVDTLMTVTKAAWTYADDQDPYIATGNRLVVNDDYDFKINVNKFDLTINKTWNGADIYKQDAIFTVSGGLGDFKVVLPANDEDDKITVTGLLCGQTYTVTEDDNWTWRWDSDNAVKTITGDPHDVSTTDPHDAEHDEEDSFVNSLAKRLWLSFCTFIENIFQKGGN